MIEDTGNRRRGLVHLIIGILVFGSIRGFFEATINNRNQLPQEIDSVLLEKLR